MSRVVALVAGWLLVAGGVALFVLYTLTATGRAGDVEKPIDAAPLGGFALSIGAAGIVCLLAAARRRGRRLVGSVRFPTTWTSLLLFGVALGGGAVAARSERWPVIDVGLAVLAVTAVLMFYGRVVLHWGPRRSVAGSDVLSSGAWGMVGAPFVAVVLQGLAFLALVVAVLAGLYVADPDLMREARANSISDMVEGEGDFAGHATVAIALTGTYALVAPLTEELAKFLGVAIFLRRRAPSRYIALTAGVSVGLGFAVVETLAYGLSAGELWPVVVGVRAPMTLIHITGAGLCALGWWAQRERGGLRLLWYYLAAVAVHGSWNGLTAAALFAGSVVDDPEDLPVGTVLLILNVLMLMAVLLAACAVWLTLSARRFGREATRRDDTVIPPRPTQDFVMDRGPVLTGVAAGEA